MSAGTAQPLGLEAGDCDAEPGPMTVAEFVAAIWPSSTRTRTASELRDLERILDVATAIAQRYAPAAPQALVNAAIVRFGGYMTQADFGTIRSETLGPRSREYVVNHAAMWRNSGAAALLTNHRRRRGGAC